jgi:hypothetical protein
VSNRKVGTVGAHLCNRLFSTVIVEVASECV